MSILKILPMKAQYQVRTSNSRRILPLFGKSIGTVDWTLKRSSQANESTQMFRSAPPTKSSTQLQHYTTNNV